MPVYHVSSCYNCSVPGVFVATIKDLQKRTRSVAQAALDFKQDRLYGSHVRRQSSKFVLYMATTHLYTNKSYRYKM